MKTRLLGCNQAGEALTVPAVGLGCMGLSQAYPPFPEKEEGIRFLREAVDAGAVFLDTAEVYGIYKNEELVGEALEGIRDRVILATKIGWRICDGKRAGLDSRPESVRKAVEGCLRRLRTDHIDLLYQHRVDPEVPIEEVAGVMSDLYKEGKIRFWGMSEPGVETLRRANSVFRVAAVENEYSLWFREAEREMIPVLEELGIGLVPFAPLGRGVLAGRVRRGDTFPKGDTRGTIPRFSDPELLDANLALADLVNETAAAHGVSPATFSLAWILRQKPWIVPIPGSRKLSRVLENLAAADFSMPEEDWYAFQAKADAVRVTGDRYDPAGMAMVGR